MTPRQFGAFLYLAQRRRKIEKAELLGHMAIAFRSEGKDVKQSIKQLVDDA